MTQKTESLNDSRWRSVLDRDASKDGAFFYAVKTTGIFCRPTCPSRRPRPENVLFFDDVESARAAGFRPCERCRPDVESRTEAHAKLIEKACRRIEEAENPPSLDELAKQAGVSRFHFHRLFKSITGLTPKAYGVLWRARKVQGVLTGNSGGVTQALYEAGFNSSSRFYESAQEILGMNPSTYKKGGNGAEIKFAIGESSMGSILVAASAKGVCAIFMGDDPEKLICDLEKRFPNALLVGGDAEFEDVVAKVVGIVESPKLGLDLPLDLQGTAFQQRVWQALMKVPPGKTVSYADIALGIGRPTASRAVAQACGANKIAIAIPCHRIVRKDGAISGYRWGVERKKILLEKESG